MAGGPRLGVIDVKSSAVGEPGPGRRQDQRALEYVDPGRLVVNPDCGLRHLAPEVAMSKLRAMYLARRLSDQN